MTQPTGSPENSGRFNQNNCGSCGKACDTAGGFTCQGGVCGCPAGLTDCSGTCVDLQTDVYNCGTCGNACLVPDCDGKLLPCTVLKGTCPDACPSGQCPCGLACVDPLSDSKNCGSCGNACASGQTCVSGQCV